MSINVDTLVKKAMALTTSVHQHLTDPKNCELLYPCELVALMQKADALSTQIAPNTPEAEKLDGARALLESLRPLVDKHELPRFFNALRQKSGNSPYLNLAHSGPIALRCPATGAHCIPDIGCYGESYEMGGPLVKIRLHPVQFHPPISVQETIQGENITCIEAFFLASFATDAMQREAKKNYNFLRYNLVTHAWVHPGAQHDQDSQAWPKMGIFEPTGIAEVDGNDGIAFGSLKPMEVYIHPKNGATAYSPNNAHFAVLDEAPFSAFWYVVVPGDGRALVVHQWIINDTSHPLCEKIKDSLVDDRNRCLSLAEQSKSLMKGIPEYHGLFEEVASAFLTGSSKAKELFFTRLTQAQQNRAYFYAWEFQKKPDRPEGDPGFGIKSFFNETCLEQKHWCNPMQQYCILKKICEEEVEKIWKLTRGLCIQETPASCFPPLSTFFSKEFLEKVKAVNPILKNLRKGKENKAMELLSNLSDTHKGKIYEMAWKLQLRPLDKGIGFGEESFKQSLNLPLAYRCTRKEQIDVLTLYLYI